MDAEEVVTRKWTEAYKRAIDKVVMEQIGKSLFVPYDPLKGLLTKKKKGKDLKSFIELITRCGSLQG